MNAAQKPSFGFADIQPDAVVEADQSHAAAAADMAGEKLGFPTREVPIRRRRQVSVPEPTDQLNLRAAISDINRFVEWCETERMSYREAFGRLVRMID